MPALACVVCLLLLVAAGPGPVSGQGIPETDVRVEPVAGNETAATWADLRETGLTLVVEGAAGDQELFASEGLILMVVRVEGGRPMGAWRSRRVVGVTGGRSDWEGAYVPEAEVGEERFRLVVSEGAIPTEVMMAEGPEGLAALRNAVEQVGEDPGSFVALILLPLEPEVARRTRVRPLLAFPL